MDMKEGVNHPGLWEFTLLITFSLAMAPGCFGQFGINNSCDGGRLIVPTKDSSYCSRGDWILTFEEDFSDSILDLEKWQPVHEGMLGGEAHCSYQTLDNLVIENGIAKLFANDEPILRRAINYKDSFEILSDGIQNLRWFNYSSTTIRTHKAFRYGYFEASCKIPKGMGFWPAMWMYGADAENGFDSTTISNEIDVFEFWRNDSKNINMNVHIGENSCLEDRKGVDYSKDFHVYTMIWEPYKIEWYVDGELIRRYSRFYQMGKEVGCQLNAWQCYEEALFPLNPMLIYFDLYIDKIGGYLPDETTPFPSALEVDWVRYYERTDLQDFSQEKETNVNVYPNPSSGLFNIEINPSSEKMNARVFNVYGEKLIQFTLDKNRSILDLRDKSKGVYILIISDPKSLRQSTHKLFLE